MKKKNQPVLIIDFLNIFTRHFTVNPTLNKDGIPVGGVVGFLNNFKYILEEIYPKKVVIVFESGGSPRRRSLFKDYKSNRKPIKLNSLLVISIASLRTKSTISSRGSFIILLRSSNALSRVS